jgi:hypothetical protein
MSTKPNFKLTLHEGVLTRNVDSSKHYFIKYRAYAYDEDELQKYEGQWHTLEIITTGGKCYQVNEVEFYRHSYLNTDYGKTQRFINVADMKVKENKGKMVRISNEMYQELKAESKKRRQPMSTLIEVKKRPE